LIINKTICHQLPCFSTPICHAPFSPTSNPVQPKLSSLQAFIIATPQSCHSPSLCNNINTKLRHDTIVLLCIMNGYSSCFLKNLSWSVLTKIRPNQPEKNHKTTRDSSQRKPKNQPKKKLEITTWLPPKKPLFLYVSCTCNTRPIHPTVAHSARTNTALPLSGSFLIVVEGQFRVQNEFVCFV